ncbi:MAG: NAD(P)/FAD-dependent oxidoreductase [Nitrospirota bacterium]|nr:NAD(P)/FAD-dependent oxidoreductase [Nitrospirota bacterium]MDH5769029.1 NAD(P)/FAD-dependent oxidoreductase [Nitrospirota bacterium]
MVENQVYDCIIIGAGPGGLQAAIYLGRYNRNILILDRGGGRTRHARHIENFLTQKSISGKELIEIGIEQAQNFNIHIQKMPVTKVLKNNYYFKVYTRDNKFLSKFVIVSSGVYDILPPIENLHKFLGVSFFTCIDCDGYRTTGKRLVIIGDSLKTVHLAFAMKEMFTKDITLIPYHFEVPREYEEELREKNIRLIIGEPIKIIGEEKIEAIEINTGQLVECEAIMSDFGYKLNDEFLSDLPLKRDKVSHKFITNSNYESSLNGMYIVGPLNTGNDQAIIAAGEGAVAAIDINKRLLEF